MTWTIGVIVPGFSVYLSFYRRRRCGASVLLTGIPGAVSGVNVCYIRVTIFMLLCSFACAIFGSPTALQFVTILSYILLAPNR